MRCIPIALLLAALASACTSADSRQRRLYDAAQDDVWQGAATRALERIQKGEAVAGAPASQWGWKFRLLRTEALLLRRDTAAALTLLNGLPPLERPDPALAARRGYLRALAQTYQGQLSEAAATLEEARQQAHAAPADGVLLDIDALQGQLHLRAGRLRDADALLQDLLARASARGDAYHQAVALHNLGNGRITRNRFDEALVFFERILELKELEQYIIYGTALIGAGISYARLGQFDRAVSVQRRSIESHEKRDPPTYLGLALGELGNTYVLHEEQRRGLDYLARALKVATAAGAASEAAIWAGNLAKVAIDLGNFDEAERFNREAIRLKTRTRGSTLYNTFYSARIASGRGQLADAKRLYQETLEGSEGQPGVRWETLDGLARVALAAGDRRTAARHFGAALDTIQQTRSDLLKTEYRLTFLSRVIRFYQDYVDTLVATGDTTRALEVADSSRAVVLAERMGGSATTQAASVESFVAAAKRTGSVWLTYWLAPERSYVWVVTGNGIRCVPLPGASAIEQLVKDYRAMVQRTATDPLTSPGSAGDALYAMVVAPVARFIPPGSPVRIVADGALHGINFETLPVDGPRRHYWIEDVTVGMAPSLGLLASDAARPPAATSGRLLLIGDPTPRDREFPRLGYAPVEMQAVAKYYGDRTTRYDRDHASPSEYFAAGPERFSVIHFTAHAAANRTSPLDSAVILAGPAGADKLYARDVAARSLRAELVTISACRSAGERAYMGEGLIGFSWAFLHAGARQVIAGLWDVDDQYTARLMDTLYAGIARGESAPDALRAAKLALIRQGGSIARPYYWGPFELFTVSP